MKLVLNKCYGGFGISKEAVEFMAADGCHHAKAALDASVKHKTNMYQYGYADNLDSYDRTNPHLIKAVEQLGKKANGPHAELVVVDIPDGEAYQIEDYDGMETVRQAYIGWAY